MIEKLIKDNSKTFFLIAGPCVIENRDNAFNGWDLSNKWRCRAC